MLRRARATRFVYALLGILLFAGSAASSQVIDFDDASDGQVINDFYSSQGVTFTCISCFKDAVPPEGNGSTEVIAREAQDFSPPSAPNVVAPLNESNGDGCYSEDEEGIVRAMFDSMMSTVSVRVITDDDSKSNGDIGWMRAFNASDVMVDEVFSSNLIGVGNNEIIAVSGDIAYVEFAGLEGNDTCFDDLTFGSGVPTMPWAGLGVLLAVLALISAWILRRRVASEV